MSPPVHQHKLRLKSYKEAFEYLLAAIDYERISKYQYDASTFNLNRVRDLAAAAGNPHVGQKFVHVAGTKGKGSTSIMLASLLTEHGLRTGLLTSPHLVKVEERIRVDRAMISERRFLRRMNEIVSYIDALRQKQSKEAPTYWEILTVLAFMEFAKRRTDMNVIEVGLGGRLDSTNIITPRVVIITRIDFDHMDKLGNTLEKIAREKAGIIKLDAPLVTCDQPQEAMQVFQSVCRREGIRLHRQAEIFAQSDVELDGVPGIGFGLRTERREYPDLFIPLLGRHQTENAALAIVGAELLEEQGELVMDLNKVRAGFRKACPEARIQIISTRPLIVLDCAHNPVSARALKSVIKERLRFRRLILVIGMSSDKNIDVFLQELLPLAERVIFTQADNPRAAEPEFLLERARALSSGHYLSVTDANAAVSVALKNLRSDDLLCITGSFYLAGEMKSILERELRTP